VRILNFLLFLLLIPVVGFSQNNGVNNNLWWAWSHNETYTPKNITSLTREDSTEYNDLVRSIDVLIDKDIQPSNYVKKSIKSTFKYIFFGKWKVDESIHLYNGSNYYSYTINNNYKYIYEIFTYIGECYKENVGEKKVELYMDNNQIVFYTKITYPNEGRECFEVTCDFKTHIVEIHKTIFE
jgi:hypothetical protein